MTIRCASIGCGRRAAMFAEAMLSVEGAELVGSADPYGDAAATHCGRFGGSHFLDLGEMLAAAKPDFVSVVTRPNVRLEPIKACIEAGVQAIHCEKPMAISWGEAKAIRDLAQASGVQVTFSHQRRYLAKFEAAKRLIAEGAIGKLQRLEGCCDNFYDWGTHWFDIFFFLNQEQPAESVIAQADRSEPKMVFDQPVDRSGVAVASYANGVKGVLFTGKAQPSKCSVRAFGEDGLIEVRMGKDQPMTMITPNGVRNEPLEGVDEGDGSVGVAVVDAMRCWREGETCRLDSRYAAAATELIFASYASSQRGGPVPLPLVGDLSLREAFDLDEAVPV
jgi:UDP-N-acetylglucosamine 3-dehydrogenase